uniref:Uncharacterized protein n=1 Tax=Populus alba TaxID=43335 RepID=A0A4U5NAK1_POPAL|nr:hypothetical protein D5086_0000272680 [Populus alba]
MEDNHDLLISVSFTCYFLQLSCCLQTRKKRRNLPPSPTSYSIYRSSPISSDNPSIEVLRPLKEIWPNSYLFDWALDLWWLYHHRQLLKKCFTKNDIVFANRPQFLAGKYLHYNNTTLASASYGDHWRNLRRICAIEILLFVSPQRIFGHQKGRNQAIGKRYYGEDVKLVEEPTKFKETLQGYAALSELTNLGDVFPIFQSVDYMDLSRGALGLSNRMDLILQGLIDELRRDKNGKHR